MKSCYECCCIDTIDNPVIGVEDSQGMIVEWICTVCYAQRIPDEDTHSDA